MSGDDPFATDPNNMSDVFGVCSAIAGRPIVRKRVASREEAEKELAAMRAADAKSERGEEDEYYVVQLSKGEAAAFEGAGAIEFTDAVA